MPAFKVFEKDKYYKLNAMDLGYFLNKDKFDQLKYNVMLAREYDANDRFDPPPNFKYLLKIIESVK